MCLNILQIEYMYMVFLQGGFLKEYGPSALLLPCESYVEEPHPATHQEREPVVRRYL